MKFSQVKARQPAHILIIGEPKTGKTLLLASLAQKGYKIIFFSLDKGASTLFNKVPKDILEKNFEFVFLPDTTDFPVAYQTMYAVLQGRSCHICDNHGMLDCIVCKRSSDNTWTDICLNEVGLDTVVVMDHGTQLTKSAMNYYLKKKKLDPEEYKFEWEDWRKLGVMMDRIFLPIQQSANNWVVLAHVAEVEMEDGKKKLTAAIGTGNYARNSGGFFDHVVYCEVANAKHAVGSSTTFRVSAITGSRSDIAIEKLLDKDGRATLVPFFDGTIPTENKNYAQATADKLLTVPPKEEPRTVPNESGAPAVLLGLPASPDVVVGDVEQNVVVPAGASREIAAGVSTPMHALAPVSTTPLLIDQNAKAKALLEAFKKKGN